MKTENENISSRLVELLRMKEFLQALEELFHPEAVRTEPDFHPQKMTHGLQKLLSKEHTFLKSIKVWKHFEVSDPIVSKAHFALRMHTKLLMHNDQKLEIDEIIVYQTSKGKIVKEEFFYFAPGRL